MIDCFIVLDEFHLSDVHIDLSNVRVDLSVVRVDLNDIRVDFQLSFTTHDVNRSISSVGCRRYFLLLAISSQFYIFICVRGFICSCTLWHFYILRTMHLVNLHKTKAYKPSNRRHTQL